MPTYFNINYEFDRQIIWNRIDEQLQKEGAQYICVADGNILQMVHKDLEYRNVVNKSMFSICDSSWATVFLKRLYGVEYQQYCGSQIFEDLTNKRQYRQFFIGTSEKVLDGLKNELSKVDPSINGMTFFAPPFCKVEEFDYPAIADMINKDNPDIVWVALGAPKQENFMYRLQPYLKRGVMIGVGAVFNFYCGLENAPKRAPRWIVKLHLEFLYRVFSEPKKQLKRCKDFLLTLPKIYKEEKRRAKSQR
jgi:N-acetylglucosaminyldiphosphoundecaprenol N-acetyl-beta-D-mannosaminyltransferase